MVFYLVQSAVDQLVAKSSVVANSAVTAIREAAACARSRMGNVCAYMTPLVERLSQSKSLMSHKVEEYVSQSKTEAHHRVVHFSKTIPPSVTSFFDCANQTLYSIVSAYLALVTVFIGRAIDLIADSASCLNSKVSVLTDQLPYSWLLPPTTSSFPEQVEKKLKKR